MSVYVSVMNFVLDTFMGLNNSYKQRAGTRKTNVW